MSSGVNHRQSCSWRSPGESPGTMKRLLRWNKERLPLAYLRIGGGGYGGFHCALMSTL